MKAMLSQPMNGKTDKEIVTTREKAIKVLEEKGYEVVNTLFTDEWYSDKSMSERGVVNIPLCFLTKSLESMSLCNVAYFCKGGGKDERLNTFLYSYMHGAFGITRVPFANKLGGNMEDYLLNLYREMDKKAEEASQAFEEDKQNRVKREQLTRAAAQSDLMDMILGDLNIEVE
ncbi:hypothetical protein QE152_g38900 [Popillia japonica]|uniref:Uncharacterized protein n=1 Tax=Popillia japonica TaxID=7064 RepID=A0AAW1HV48_POPJA